MYTITIVLNISSKQDQNEYLQDFYANNMRYNEFLLTEDLYEQCCEVAMQIKENQPSIDARDIAKQIALFICLKRSRLDNLYEEFVQNICKAKEELEKFDNKINDEAIVLKGKNKGETKIKIILVPEGTYIHASQTLIKKQSFKKKSWFASIVDQFKKREFDLTQKLIDHREKELQKRKRILDEFNTSEQAIKKANNNVKAGIEKLKDIDINQALKDLDRKKKFLNKIDDQKK